jgi:hypothetical protein
MYAGFPFPAAERIVANEKAAYLNRSDLKMNQDTRCSMMTTSCRMLSVLVTLGIFYDFQGEKLHHLMLGIAQYNRAPDDPHGIIFLLGTFSANGLGC